MVAPRVLILRAPGTNCDVETAHAFELAGAVANRIHIQQLIDRPSLIDNYQILCFPGGFSYGDDIASGRILATQLLTQLPDAMEAFREDDRLVFGICNGFQIMIRLGIFFDSSADSRSSQTPATLNWNRQGRFENRWVHLKVLNQESPFLRGIDTIYLPMAHAEGRFVIRGHDKGDQTASQLLESNNQLPLRYCRDDGYTSQETLEHPINPNGADLNVAGMCDTTGRIFGMMPHPERHLYPTHHPFWTRRYEQPKFGDGLRIFQNCVDYFQ